MAKRAGVPPPDRGYGSVMSALSVILIVIVLLALGVLGAIVKGLLWLTAIAAMVFVIGAVYGYVRFRFRSSTPT
jgi:lysylphosphatidylglycerol synthetase-like protein (DUF2156 family)